MGQCYRLSELLDSINRKSALASIRFKTFLDDENGSRESREGEEQMYD